MKKYRIINNSPMDVCIDVKGNNDVRDKTLVHGNTLVNLNLDFEVFKTIRFKHPELSVTELMILEN